jgi:hypothetical protein
MEWLGFSVLGSIAGWAFATGLDQQVRSSRWFRGLPPHGKVRIAAKLKDQWWAFTFGPMICGVVATWPDEILHALLVIVDIVLVSFRPLLLSLAIWLLWRAWCLRIWRKTRFVKKPFGRTLPNPEQWLNSFAAADLAGALWLIACAVVFSRAPERLSLLTLPAAGFGAVIYLAVLGDWERRARTQVKPKPPPSS